MGLPGMVLSASRCGRRNYVLGHHLSKYGLSSLDHRGHSDDRRGRLDLPCPPSSSRCREVRNERLITRWIVKWSTRPAIRVRSTKTPNSGAQFVTVRLAQKGRGVCTSEAERSS